MELRERGLLHGECLFVALFFEHVTVTLEREHFALERRVQRFELASQRFIERGFEALGNPGQRESGRSNLNHRRDHRIGQGARATARVARQQVDYATLAPRRDSVVGRLHADAESCGNLGRAQATDRQHQSRGARPDVTMSVIQGQLLQGQRFRFGQS